MRLDEIESRQVSNPLVKCRGAAQIGKKKSEAGYFQPLVDVECIGAMDVAKSLIGQKPLGGEERPAIVHDPA